MALHSVGAQGLFFPIAGIITKGRLVSLMMCWVFCTMESMGTVLSVLKRASGSLTR
jgi:hypothetical protein